MHKLKSTARQSAWYAAEDGKPNYNPFAKVRSRSRNTSSHDIETGVGTGPLGREGTYRSADFAPPTIETNRQSAYGPDTIGTTHANTMPANGWPRNQPSSSRALPSDPEKDPKRDLERDPEKGRKEISQDSAATTNDTLIDESRTGETQARKRKSGGFMSVLHLTRGGKNDTELEQTTTGKSKKPKPHFTLISQIRGTLFNSWINVLLIAVPVGIALNFAGVPPIAVFVVNFIAIIPLAAMLSYATEEIALRVGETLGGLLNATFGNAVELIVSIIALAKDEVLIVQTSLIGSILSNLLLVLGMCFFLGGLNRVKQCFNKTVAQTATSLLALAVGSLIIPTTFTQFASGTGTDNLSHVAALSRGTSVLLLLVYGAYLFFQLKTHSSLYNEPSQKVGKRRVKVEGGDFHKQLAGMGGNLTSVGGGPKATQTAQDHEEEKEEPQLSMLTAILTLLIVTALVGVCAEFLVDSINEVTTEYNVSPTFVGLILLPIVGNAAEHATAVTVAIKDKMDLAIGVAVGSSMQIALFVLPFVVVLGWILGKEDMNLSFDGFQIAVLFVAVLLVNYLISDGESHWLEGILLITLYVIISVAAWFYPPPRINPDGSLAVRAVLSAVNPG